MVNRFGQSSGFEVTYVQRNERSVSTLEIKTIAFSTSDDERIANYNKARLKSKRDYYDYKLFEEGITESRVLLREDIKQLKLSSRRQRTRGRKTQGQKNYVQYFATPVVCQTKSGNKMIGLIQVAVTKQEIASDEKQLIDLANCLLRPYCEVLLLIHKMRRGLMAAPGKQMADIVEW